MFTNFSFLVLVCVCAIASAVAGYCLASLRMMRNARVSQPVATEVASSQVVQVAPAPTPKSAPVINNPASPTTPTETPKTSPKKSTSPKGGVASFTSSDLPTKPSRQDFADAKAYKAAYDAWWRQCKRLTSGKPVQPKVESKESQIVTPKPVVVNNKPESSKPVSPKGNAEKPAKTSAASEFTHTEGMPAKPNRADYVDGASYKKAYDAWWRQCKKAAKGVTNVTPKAETTQPKVETKPQVVQTTNTKPSTKGAKKNAQPVQPKVEEPVQPKAETPAPVETPSKKADFLALISTKLNDGFSLNGGVNCTMGKAQRTITSVTIENGEVMFVVSDGINDAKPVAAKTVCFSKTTCAEVLNNLEKVVTPKAATNKPASSSKKNTKPSTTSPSKKEDVQPVDPEYTYRMNAVSAIVTTMNNKNVESITFGEGLKTDVITKVGNQVAVISHIDRSTDGHIMLHMTALGHAYNATLGDNKACHMIPTSTYRTIHAALNAAIGKKKDAQAKVTYIKSAC